MRRIPTFRRAALLLLASAALARGPALGADEPAAGGSGFAGSWALVASSDDVVVKEPASGWDAEGGSERPGGTGGRGVGGGFDLPLEVMTDARRLVISDDGTTFRVTYLSGRKRVFVTDGVERYLDDGDGPADVVSRRKGTTVTVSSEWRRGYKLREAWELQSSPRRLVVTGKVKGRESPDYVRRYEPAAPGDELLARAALKPVATAAPATVGVPAGEAPPAGAKPPAVDRLKECTIHPPRNAAQADLNRLVRVSQEDAGKKAVASLAPLKAGDVISSDVEAYEGCLAWPFTMRLAWPKGVQEVFVDAGDGGIVWSEFVPMNASPGEPPAP